MSASGRTSLSRRDFVSLSALGALGAVGLGAARSVGAEEAEADQLLYVGTYTTDGHSKGIYLVRMSRDSGALSLVGLVGTTSNPSFLTLSADGKVVYAVNEVAKFGERATGSVTAFARDRATNMLRELSSQPTGGADPCYVTTDRRGKSVLVANYSGGSVAAFPISSNGDIGVVSSFVQHQGKGPDAERQEGPHAHCVMPDPSNRFVLVADLGLDRIFVYGFDERSAKLTPKPVTEGTLAPGAGPRHLAFHPNGRIVYVANELNSTITVFRYDPRTGSLLARQTVPAISETTSVKNFPADLHVHPSGRFLYMSNRGPDSISAFTIDDVNSDLRPLQRESTGGKWPRNFAVDASGKFLLVANQRSDDIHSFRIDARSGNITPTGQSVSVPSPVCLRFIPDR
jgi:6-phosphogluconolactonase